jgi:MerR family redox-sensitive transcriptional activator SoxR
MVKCRNRSQILDIPIRYKTKRLLSPEQENSLKIGQVALKAQIPIVTVRFYQEQGLISTIKLSGKKDSNHRRFAPSVFSELDFIKLCRISGFSIPEIKSLMKLYKGFVPPSRNHMKAIQRSIEGIRRQKQGLDAIEKILRFRMRNPQGEIDELLLDEPVIMKELIAARKG